MTETPARPQAPWALRLLPPFPTIASRILALASNQDVSIQEMAELIQLDPSFSAELLRFANSPLFGLRNKVASVGHAIVLVGLERVKVMATLVAVNRMVRGSLKVDALRKVWTHSLVTAIIAEEAARLMHLSRANGYTAGLLHDLGSLGLMSAYPNEYSRMLQVSGDSGFDLLKAERELFEIDHCEAGAYLAREWNFPEELAVVIAKHHDEPIPGESSLDNVVRVGWRLADTLGYTAFCPKRQWSFDELIALLPLPASSWLSRSQESATEEIQERLAASAL